MIKKLLSSFVSILVPPTEPQEKTAATPIPTAVPPAKNLSATETVERPLVSELKKALRQKYPQSKFQTVFLSKKPYGGEYTVHYSSKNIHLPFSDFCKQFGLDPQSIETEEVRLSPSDNNGPKGINQFKSNVLSDVGKLDKRSVLYQKIILNYALKCSIPTDYAEKIITPVEWVRYAKDTSKKIYKPSFMIGSFFFTPDSINSKGEVYTAKMPIYAVHHFLYPLFHLNNKKRDIQLLEGKEHFVLLEGQSDVDCFNYHFRDSIYFGVTVGGVKNWYSATEQIAALKTLRPQAKFFTLFDNDVAGLSTELPFAPPLLWTDIFKTPLKKGFDVCDAFQTYPDAREAILSQFVYHSIHVKTEKHIQGQLGDYLSYVLAQNNIPIEIPSFKNTIVVSGTGTGKSRIIEELCKKGLNICIFPMNAVTAQMMKRIRAAGCNVFSYFGENPTLEGLASTQTIVTNYASFPKLCNKLKEKYGPKILGQFNLLADEVHNFTASADPHFMLKDLSCNIEYFPEFASFTGFTGTFIPNTHPFLAGLSILNVDIPIKKPVLDVLVCKNTIESTIEKVRQHVKKGEKVAILLNNKGAKLDLLKASFKDLKIAVLNSDTKESIEFQSIINNEKVSDDTQVLISTSVLKEGINVLNDIAHVYVDTKKFSLYEIWQFINRFRTSIQKGTLKVHIMCTQWEDISEKVVAFDFWEEARRLRQDCLKLIDTISNYQSATMRQAQLDGYKIFQSTPIFYDEIENSLNINELHLSYLIYKEQTIKTYSNSQTLKSVANEVGFDFGEIRDCLEQLEENEKTDLKIAVKQAKDLRQLEYENILEDLKKRRDAEKEPDFGGVTVFEHLEKMKTVKTLSVVEKIVYEGLRSVCPFYKNAETLIADVESMVKSPKKSQFLLLKRRLRARNFLKSEAMETNCEVAMVIKSIIANIICGEIYDAEELKEMILAAMASHPSFQHLVQKIKNAKRIDAVLRIIQAFFRIKINKSNGELNYSIKKIPFESYPDPPPEGGGKPIGDIF